MQGLKPKKSLGQHFLRDENIARKIIGFLPEANKQIIEIGPGEGVLTRYLTDGPWDAYFIETDREAVDQLKQAFPRISHRIIHQDFLKADLSGFFQDDFVLLGNLPYNISSQIFFRALEYRKSVQFMLFMIQKEVAERIASPPGSKNYGILSVLLQAYYEIKYLFTVNETVFYPRPKVKSAVIRLERKENIRLDCDEKLFVNVVRTAFNQRRKTLRNALKPLGRDLGDIDPELLNKRAEQLHLKDFVYLTGKLQGTPNLNQVR
jgi:16S rRNA (adenine1518-N6/adenine1519-N6)-dimethyltransferase